jgi:iron complex outermembrane recepter protein
MKLRILLGCASWLALAGAAAAQAQEPVASGRAVTALDEVVVTAQRREQKLQDVPLTVNALSGDDMARAGVATVRDLQNVVPGFTFSGQGTTAQPAIRGVSTALSAAGSENPNALYIDGIYQTAQTLLNMDLPDVERVEILKGPQGTLFGRNATGGAIQIFTRNPSFVPTGSFVAEGSYYDGADGSRSANKGDVRGFIAGPIIPDLLAGSLSAGYTSTPGFLTDDATGGRTGEIWKQNLRGKLLLTPSSTSEILLSVYSIKMNVQGNLLNPPFNRLSAAASFPGSVVPTQPWHVAFDPGYSMAKFEQWGVSARGRLSFEAGELTYLVGHNDAETVNYNSISSGRSLACAAAFACINYHFEPRTQETSQELNFSSRDFGRLSFVAGAYLYNAKGGTLGIIQENLIPGGMTVNNGTFKKTAYAFYGEGTLRAMDRLSITLGMRYNHEDQSDTASVPTRAARQVTFDSVTPRVSLRYEVTPDLNVYATWSRGEKSGLTGLTNTAIGFEPVEPEQLDAYEIGAKFAQPRLTLNGAFFYYDYQDKQEQTFLGTTAVIRNTGPVRIYGVDLDGSAKLTNELTLRAALTWIPEAEYRDFKNGAGQSTVASSLANGACNLLAVRPGAVTTAPGGFCPGIGTVVASTFDATGFRLIRSPEVTASATLSYERDMFDGAFDASATVYYSSSVKHDITSVLTQDDYVTLNAQAGYGFGEGVRVGVFGRNLTNEAYMQAGLTSASGFVPSYAPPREVGVSLSYEF